MGESVHEGHAPDYIASATSPPMLPCLSPVTWFLPIEDQIRSLGDMRITPTTWLIVGDRDWIWIWMCICSSLFRDPSLCDMLRRWTSTSVLPSSPASFLLILVTYIPHTNTIQSTDASILRTQNTGLVKFPADRHPRDPSIRRRWTAHGPSNAKSGQAFFPPQSRQLEEIRTGCHTSPVDLPEIFFLLTS